jgi:hypothetical protein
MRRFFGVAVATAMLAVVPGSHAHRSIDLDSAGNLEAVERDHPDHFAKIQRILAEVPRLPPSEQRVASWLRTEFQVRDVRYTDLIMTSLPPKKRLEFSLDEVAYVKVVTLASWQPKMMPAAESAPHK